MVRNTIELEKDMEKCKKLYEELKQIVDAYEMLPVYEKIHSKSGNKLMNTNSSNRQFYFAERFNDLIVEYVEGSVSTEDEEDTW